MHGIFTRHMGMNIGFLVLGLFQYFTTHEVRCIQMNSTGWGPQDSVQLPYFSGFIVDITIVTGSYFMVYKPIYIWGAPSCMVIPSPSCTPGSDELLITCHRRFQSEIGRESLCRPPRGFTNHREHAVRLLS